MEQRHRDIIRSNYIQLTNALKDVVNDVCTYLYQSHIISDRMKESILEGNRTSRQKAEALLDLIVKRGPSAFEILYTAILIAELYEAADILKPIRAPHMNLGVAAHPNLEAAAHSNLEAVAPPPSCSDAFPNLEAVAPPLSCSDALPNLEAVAPPPSCSDALPNLGAAALLNLEAAAPPSSYSHAVPEYEVAIQNDLQPMNVLPAQSTSSASSQSSSASSQRSLIGVSKSWPSKKIVKKEDIRVQTVQPDSQMYKDYFESLTLIGQTHYYTMQHAVRGRVLIVNNEKFIKVQVTAKEDEKVTYLLDREGSSRDKDNLDTLFRQLGFEVKIYNDQTKELMENKFQEECNQDHSNFDCFILIVLTHGHKGIVYGNDGYTITKNNGELDHYNYIKVKTIKDMFCGIRSLQGKPKLFFIQACRGSTKDKGVEVSTTAGFAESGDVSMDVQIQDAQDTLSELDMREESDGLETIPSEADYFMVLSTVSGMVSWRTTAYGTWLIQALVYVFGKNAHKEDLNKLMTMTNAYVSHAETEYGMKQVVEKRDTLRKTFCFFPGLRPGLPPPSQS